jgi:predicted transcriptional regulator
MGWFGLTKSRDSNREIEEIRRLKSSLQDSFFNVKRDMTSVGEWIKKFDSREKINEQRFKEIEKKLAMLQGMMEYHASSQKARQGERSIVHERVQSLERSNQSFMNVQTLKKVSKRLTPMQKKVIALLSLAKKPLDYNTIAKELRISVVTVRRHINDIKRAGLEVKEKVSLDSKRKVFYIEEEIKERILTNKYKK